MVVRPTPATQSTLKRQLHHEARVAHPPVSRLVLRRTHVVANLGVSKAFRTMNAARPNSLIAMESWPPRHFYASVCRFFFDVPLDLTGIVAFSMTEAKAAGFVLHSSRFVLATDSLYRGALLVEIELPQEPSYARARPSSVVTLAGDVIIKPLNEPKLRLRADAMELADHAMQLGREVGAYYFQYSDLGSSRPVKIIGMLRSQSSPPPSNAL
jgi:hypothetical protein